MRILFNYKIIAKGDFTLKKWLLTFVFVSTLIVLGACGGGGDNATEAPAQDATGDAVSADAEKLYQQSCQSCHGGNLEGGFGPQLSQVGNKYSKEEIEDIILNGQGNMRGGFLKGEEASTVAAWLAEHK
ncbi:hypothetical protein BC6307_19680 [Sutcliffiella cohnii]|uniref:Cytochrome c domain-containing protein n=1 Tax=Sutcliffiella cohnii TaxID=33932 RepID=A0A223KVD1_9BACI|nr:hypothetical protein BC6307_19680 [Sutcliffiella cohnii]